ncbi:hypothetical protein M569_01400, partial [Genlisea aurea]
EGDDEHESKQKLLQRYFMQEWKLVESLLDDIGAARRVPDLSAVHRIRSIMDKYQEQGQLVEPYLGSIVPPLMEIIRFRAMEFGAASDQILEVIKPICIIIYSLVTVCGCKSVIKFFPHQVSDLELAVSLLITCHGMSVGTSLRQESTGEMESKCILLLWLSILVLIPFDISSVDTSIGCGQDSGRDEPPPLVMSILEFCKDYLSNAGPMRKISGVLLARLLIRPDMAEAFESFIDWTHQILSSMEYNVVDHFRMLGVVEALAAVFKIGSPSILMNVVPDIWKGISVLMNSVAAAHSSLLRKYLIKLIQRIGITCLPHNTPLWHYVARNKRFGENNVGSTEQDFSQLSYSGDWNPSNLSKDVLCLEEEEDMDVPEIIEDVIELLLKGLRDTDTVVRWSAAKGVGRVTSRLSYSLADEVLSSVLELFSPGEGDGSWHGGCLALAELARRGLLLPTSFPKVVPVIIKALHYDVRRGPHSVGSHVRDAAAYVCWAFGRAYYYRDMENVLSQLAPHLLTVACYDREVNCRRAAAAAFQENVGRQGNFPHGIDIVNIADYFALSSRVNSYLHVAVSIAQYDGYLHQFVDEVMQSKICHWDRGLRELAATALASLLKFQPEYFSDEILESLSSSTLSTDLCMRYGATLAIGEVVLALHEKNFALSTDQQRVVAGIVPAIEKARLYRGKGGEIMRFAVSRFIECISRAEVTLSEEIAGNLLETLDENLKNPNLQIQNAAVEAYKHFVRAYIGLIGSTFTKDIVSRHMEQLTDSKVAARRGSALAIGVLPYEFLANGWKPVLTKLCNSCQIEDNPYERDAESRVNAVRGLVSVCETLSVSKESSEEDGLELYHFIRDDVMYSLFKALDDYSTDNRGDVGSWVREAAMNGLEICTYILCKKKTSKENDSCCSLYDVDLACEVVSLLAKQAVEKMDKLRESAARILLRILYNKSIFVPNIPERENLEAMIPNKDDLKWGVAANSFPCFVRLLQLSCYSKYVVSGLVISIGGLQDFLRKASLKSLLDYLQNSETDNFRSINLSADLLWVLEKYRKCDRVIVPTLKVTYLHLPHPIYLSASSQGSAF